MKEHRAVSGGKVDIHPAAIVSSGASLGAGVKIGPYSVIGEDVVLEENVRIHPHVVLDGVTTIGSGCEIFPFASIGSPTQDKKYKGDKGRLVVGKNNVIREHVTMNPGTYADGKTVIGDNGLFMVGSHVAHDCIVGHNVIMANNATLAGHVEVGDNAIIGGLSAVHQFIRIGQNAIIGGMSGVESDVIPYGRVKGDRAYLAGLNLIGLQRAGLAKNQIRTLQKAFEMLFAEKETSARRLEAVTEKFEGNEFVEKIVRFAEMKSKFPLCRPRKK